VAVSRTNQELPCLFRTPYASGENSYELENQEYYECEPANGFSSGDYSVMLAEKQADLCAIEAVRRDIFHGGSRPKETRVIS
jgi:hypothetical protein